MNYLIIGASSDVAREVLLKLNSQNSGAVVFAQYRNDNSTLITEASDYNNLDIRLIKCDLSSDEELNAMLDEVDASGITVDAIIYLAASSFEYMRVRKWDVEKLRRDMQVGAIAFSQICARLVPGMGKRGHGKVVVMLTSYILGVPPKFMADYIMVKSALWGYTKALAAEYADKGVNINAISPSMIETKFLKNLDERIVQADAENSAMKRHITASEVADSICMLCSDLSSHMTGINLNLSGGDEM